MKYVIGQFSSFGKRLGVAVNFRREMKCAMEVVNPI